MEEISISIGDIIVDKNSKIRLKYKEEKNICLDQFKNFIKEKYLYFL